ncbi:glycosyltransferase family 9 protein, partial [Candidatus Riflebacteria bacterium]
HITWITSPVSMQLLQGITDIDRLLKFDADVSLIIATEKFDFAFCLDKELPALQLMELSQANEKRGLRANHWGKPVPCGHKEIYYYKLGLCNNEKFFVNKKSYQQLLFEALGFEWQGQDYIFARPDAVEAEHYFAGFIGKNKLQKDRTIIGFIPGAGERFAGKRWPIEHYLELARMLLKKRECYICFLGGKQDEKILLQIQKYCSEIKELDGKIFFPGWEHSIPNFARILSQMNVVVCGDTLPMHIAIALKIPAVILFGSTCAQEIEPYGRGRKLSINRKCSPCYLKICPYAEECQSEITPEVVLNEVEKFL